MLQCYTELMCSLYAIVLLTEAHRCYWNRHRAAELSAGESDSATDCWHSAVSFTGKTDRPLCCPVTVITVSFTGTTHKPLCCPLTFVTVLFTGTADGPLCCPVTVSPMEVVGFCHGRGRHCPLQHHG